MKWVENSFFDHLDKFASSLGFENYEIAIPLSMVPWASPEDRDIFIITIKLTITKLSYFYFGLRFVFTGVDRILSNSSTFVAISSSIPFTS